MSTPHRDFREALTTAITRTDAPWAFNRDNVRRHTIEAALYATWPVVLKAIHEAEESGYMRGRAASAADLVATADAGYVAGRRDALLEAATMLKRHGHRTAVDRVQALATPTVDTDTISPPTGAQNHAHSSATTTAGATR